MSGGPAPLLATHLFGGENVDGDWRTQSLTGASASFRRLFVLFGTFERKKGRKKQKVVRPECSDKPPEIH